jgi:hypothetical protein
MNDAEPIESRIRGVAMDMLSASKSAPVSVVLSAAGFLLECTIRALSPANRAAAIDQIIARLLELKQ